MYVSPQHQKSGRYGLQFLLAQITVAGILVSFTVQGYGFYSILFSSFFQLLSYWFLFRLLRDAPMSVAYPRHRYSFSWVQWAAAYNFISTLGPWAVGILSARGFGGTEYYDAAIYFFLHFQYNGWFVLLLPALFFYSLEQREINYDKVLAGRLLIFTTVSVLPAYALSLLGMSISRFFTEMIWVSVLLILPVFYYGCALLKKLHLKNLLPENREVFLLFVLALIAFFSKHLLQVASALPFMRELVFGRREIVIAYLHWVMLGAITSGFFVALYRRGVFIKKKLFSLGAWLFLTGFITTEFLLTGAGLGFAISGYTALLAVSAVTMLIGILLYLGAVKYR